MIDNNGVINNKTKLIYIPVFIQKSFNFRKIYFMRKFLLLPILFMSISVISFSQKTAQEILSKGIKLNIADNPDYFVKLGTGIQVWGRYMQLNKNSIDTHGKSIESASDIALRRAYISSYAHLDRITMFAMFCMTSQPVNVSVSPFAKTAPSFYFYDAWTSYSIHNEHLSIGMGLNMYNGLSRFSSASSASTLTADVPIISVPNLLTTEQQARQLSVFATGKFGKFDYRIAIAKPFLCDMVPEIPQSNVSYEYENHNLSYKGYFQMQLFDKESHQMPFFTASYLGSKRILNVGVGADYHPESTIVFDENHDSSLHHKLHVGADVYLDIPIGKTSSITWYAGLFYFDYGPNYLLSYGTMDLFGNSLSEPQQGTGIALHSQIGYVLPIRQNNGHTTQVYASAVYRDFEAIENSNVHIDAGINYYFAGHNAKVTIEGQFRPVLDNLMNDYYYRSIIIFKTQVFI